MNLKKIIKEALVFGDYPYYRDEVRYWENKLKKMKELGINVVTFYIPWRHHQLANATYQFGDDKNLPNRNIKLFLTIIHKLGLYAIARPGPFIHAEVELGGLPDAMSPSFNKHIRPIRDWKDRNSMTSEGKELPFPFDPLFSTHANDWYKAVMRDLLHERLYPQGPIIGIQIGNEGIFSDCNWKNECADFSNFFMNTVTKINKPLNYVCYKAYIEQFTKIIRRYSERIPVLFSIAAPSLANTLTGWFNKVVPEAWQQTATHSYTNWQGNAVYDYKAYQALLLAAKRFPGINIEENAGFTWDDTRLKNPHTFIFHAALHLAAGAQGISLYPAVSTASWTHTIAVNEQYIKDHPHRRKYYHAPYGNAAPITHNAKKSSRYETIQSFLKYIKKFYNPEDYITKAPLLIIWPKSILQMGDKNTKHIFDQELKLALDYAYFNGLDFDLIADDIVNSKSINSYLKIISLRCCKNSSLIDSNKLLDISLAKNLNILNKENNMVFTKKHKNENQYCCFVFNLRNKKQKFNSQLLGKPIEIILPAKSILILTIDGNSKTIKNAYSKAKIINHSKKLPLKYNNFNYNLREAIENSF